MSRTYTGCAGDMPARDSLGVVEVGRWRFFVRRYGAPQVLEPSVSIRPQARAMELMEAMMGEQEGANVRPPEIVIRVPATGTPPPGQLLRTFASLVPAIEAQGAPLAAACGRLYAQFDAERRDLDRAVVALVDSLRASMEAVPVPRVQVVEVVE